MVYLIHFDRPFGHAKHYIGFSSGPESVKKRLQHHAKGSGSKIMRAVSSSGIGWRVVRVWWNEGRSFERKLKNRGGAARCCPICQGKKSRLRAPYWRFEPRSRLTLAMVQEWT